MYIRTQFLRLISLSIIIPAGCDGSSSVPGTGTVSLADSDTPVQIARRVCIEFSEAEFKRSGSLCQVIEIDPPAKVDLLAYHGMNAAPLLIDETLEAGDYQWVWLSVNVPRGGIGASGAGMNDADCVGSGSYFVTEDGDYRSLYSR